MHTILDHSFVRRLTVYSGIEKVLEHEQNNLFTTNLTGIK